MIVGIIALVAAFVVAGIVLGRQTSHQKKAAIADLKREKEALAQTDIFDLVLEEIEDLGLRSIEGAEELQPGVLLKTWRDHSEVVEGCPDRSNLHFEVADGVEPSEATDEDVTLVCDGTSESDDPPGTDPGD